jgi:hypothetical protein
MIPLGQAVDDYLAMRRALGYKLIEHGRVLPQFIEFLAQREAQLITIELALEAFGGHGHARVGGVRA